MIDYKSLGSIFSIKDHKYLAYVSLENALTYTWQKEEVTQKYVNYENESKWIVLH